MTDIRTSFTELTAEDGFSLSAYHAAPVQGARAALVLAQEIFGINNHIRSVAERFARAGYEVLAPSFFDRIERGVQLGYDQASIAQGRTFPPRLGFDKPLLDVRAAVARLGANQRVGIVGFCWGGSLAFLSATRDTGVSAAVGYYGGAIVKHADAATKAPTLLHFGKSDAGIPLADVELIREKRPELEIELYDAGHGFNCDQRGSYHEPSAQLAWERTLRFLGRHLD